MDHFIQQNTVLKQIKRAVFLCSPLKPEESSVILNLKRKKVVN